MADIGVRATTQGFDQAERDIKRLTGALDETKDTVSGSGSGDGLTGAFSNLSDTAKAAGLVLGGAVVVSAVAAATKLKDATEETIALGDKLHNLSQITGMSVEKLGGLKLAAEVSGTSLEGLAQGVSQFNQRFDQAQKGTGAAADAFKRLGIVVQDVSEQEAWDLFVRKMSTMEDGAEKIGIGTDLMGRSFRNLVPLINEGADGLAKLEREAKQAGIVMSTETAEAANKLNMNMAVLKAYGQGFWMEIASPIIEGLAKITTAMRDARNESSGLLSTLMAGARRGFAELFFDDSKDKLEANRAKEARLIKSIREKEDKKSSPGFRTNAIFEQTLASEYIALQKTYEERGTLEELYDVDQPDYFSGGKKTQPPSRAQSSGGSKSRNVEHEQSLAQMFAADEKYHLDLLALQEIDEGEIELFYAAWADRAGDNDSLRASILAKGSRHLQSVMAADQREIEKRYRDEERLIGMVEKSQEKADREAMSGIKNIQREQAQAAHEEVAAIKNSVFMTRNERIGALEALRQKYHDLGITGEDAEKLIQKEMRHTKTDAQEFSEQLAKMFSLNIPQSVLKTVGTIKGDLSTAIFDIMTGSKSMGESVEGFFKSISASILKMLADIAANEVMKWIFLGTPVGSMLGIGGSVAGSALGSGSTSLLGGAASWMNTATGGGSVAAGTSGAAGLAPVVEASITSVGGASIGTTGFTAAELGAFEAGGASSGSALMAAAPYVAAGALVAGLIWDWNKDTDTGLRSQEQARAIADEGITSEFLRVIGRPPTSAEVNALFSPDMITPLGSGPYGGFGVRTGDLSSKILQLTGAPSALGAGERAYFGEQGYIGIIDDYGNIRQSEYAMGTDTIVSRPTLFSAGETGTERVTVEPLAGASRSRLTGGLSININGPAMFDEYTFRRFQRMILAT